MLLFWERGYEAVSIRDLTATMGINTPSLYAAFTDKQALFEEAVDAYAQRYGGYIAEALGSEPTAYRATRRLLTQAATQQTLPGLPAGCLILNGASNHSAAAGSVAAGLRARRLELAAIIEDLARADIEREDLPSDTDTHALATFAVAVWRGLAQLARDGYSRHDLQVVVDAAMRAWPAGAAETEGVRVRS